VQNQQFRRTRVYLDRTQRRELDKTDDELGAFATHVHRNVKKIVLLTLIDFRSLVDADEVLHAVTFLHFLPLLMF